MLGKLLFHSSDVVSTSFGAATIAIFATAALTLLGLGWVSERWRIPLALSGVATLSSALSYLDAAQVWLSTQTMSAAYRYIGWFTVQPLQVASLFFLACIAGPVPAGVFWRTAVAAVLMVLSRYLGDAGLFNATLGVLLSVAFWLYILGEQYFGAMSAAIGKSSGPMRLGYFWVRLIFTVGWAIYPILTFVDVVIGAGQAPGVIGAGQAPGVIGAGQAHGVIVLYTLADLVNLVAVSLIILAVASKERY